MDDLSLKLPSFAMETALYVVATPIGNLSDISLRALQTLHGCDKIACEDTRVTGKLLQRYSIKTPMFSYHEHNAAEQTPHILSLLSEGKSVALVSDAGTPLISDPGFHLVNEVRDAGLKVIPIPGASSPITALSAAGLPTDAIFFGGFLPPKMIARQKRLETLKDIPATLAFLESPKRLIAALEDCVTVLGEERQVVVARELTKIHETFHRGSLGSLLADFQNAGTPKGEIVLLIEPPLEKEIDPEAVDDQLRLLLKTMRVKEAAEKLAKETGLAKRDLYQRALVLKEQVE